MLNINQIRSDFPILQTEVNGFPLVYLDNGATAQKPQAVIDVISNYHETTNSNVHRGVHQLSQKATLAYETARKTIAHYINAAQAHEVIFTKGTTDGINIIAKSIGKTIQTGDEILITELEHHSNIVPWQMVVEEKEATLKIIPVDEKGDLDLEELENLLTDKTKILALTHISNTLGTINPVKEIIVKAHQKNIPVLLDGAQAVPHMKVDVHDLDCDFYVFSGHKLFGPTGIGVLYGKEAWLNQLPPVEGGGGMIKTVTFENTTYADLPEKFEAGTPNISGAIGLAAACDYVSSIGLEGIAAHENELLEYAKNQLQVLEEIEIYGNPTKQASVISFNIKNTHPFDTGAILDQLGIAVRTGHHCNQPLMQKLGILGTVRASFAFYNSREDIDQLKEGLKKAIKLLV